MRDVALWLMVLGAAACLSGWTLSDRAHLALAAATIASAWVLVASLVWGVAVMADDDVTVEGRARWARAWGDLVAAAALVLGYRCVSPAGDLWQSGHGGAPQPLDRLVHEIRRALRKGGPKRRGFERALVEAELAQVHAAGWRAELVNAADPTGPQRYSRIGGVEGLTLSTAAAVCRAEALHDELAAIGPTVDGPVLVRGGYDQRQAEGCDEVQRAPVDDGGVWAGDDCEGAGAPDDGLSVHGGCVTPLAVVLKDGAA